MGERKYCLRRVWRGKIAAKKKREEEVSMTLKVSNVKLSATDTIQSQVHVWSHLTATRAQFQKKS